MRYRLALLRSNSDSTYKAQRRKVRRADRSRQARFMKIVESLGWPSPSLVGSRAANAAFALATHLPSLDAQRRCVEALRRALKRGERCGFEFAFLVDRVRLRRRKRQAFATHLVLDAATSRLVPLPTFRIGAVDARRRALGICTLKRQIAEQVRLLEE